MDVYLMQHGEALPAELDPSRCLSELSPGADVQAAAAALIDPAAAGSLAIVGHLPFLDGLASTLVAGDPGAHVLAVRNGGLVKLVPADPGWAVAWAITPEVAGG